jgi:hypothetical protein
LEAVVTGIERTPQLLVRTVVYVDGVNNSRSDCVLPFWETRTDQCGPRLLQSIRVLILQEQLARADPPVVNFNYPQAQALVADMPDLNFAFEKFAREKLATKFQQLANWKLSTTHNLDAVLTHALNKAGIRRFVKFQSASMSDRYTRFLKPA